MSPLDIVYGVGIVFVCLVSWSHERRLDKMRSRMNLLERLIGFKLVMAALGCKEKKKGAKK